LAKYGLEVDYFEYTNTIIEREYQERIATIKKIETEINELTTIITELTTKINIEKSSSVEILEIIKQKKDRLLILIKRQKELLKTFRK
jgi:flagellar biosynthesis/type III secretory pathway chaperone